MLVDKHLVLIGFKHVGKSVIGKQLASQTDKPFIDLDKNIEALYQAEKQQTLLCRDIVQQQGEAFFRDLETLALQQVMQLPAAIVSLGGGTVMREKNQQLIQRQHVIHLIAPPGIVFERIMINGRPSFFNAEEDVLVSFNRLWEEREKIYSQIRHFAVENNGSIDDAVEKIIKKIGIQ
jgi:shikimate kinase